MRIGAIEKKHSQNARNKRVLNKHKTKKSLVKVAIFA
jgi:hypothetical protein